MRHGFLTKTFSCFLCVSFILLTGGISTAGAKEANKPLGDMTSRGEVKFEAREGAWKNVDPSYFPVFQGMKIKTEKGAAVISLAKRSQVEMKTNTLLSFEQRDLVRISQGQIEFRLSPAEALAFKVGSVVILSSPAMQADARALAAAQVQDIHGSIQVHSNGSVTVKTSQGKLNILNQERKVLAALAGKESLTLPLPLMDKPAEKAPQMIKTAQVGEVAVAAEGTTGLGIPAWAWGVGAGVVVVGGIALVAGGGGSSCP
jgi:hypothetical protein